MLANDNSLATARQNAQVLQAIINIAQTTDCTSAHPYSAIILFPGHQTVPVQDTNGHDRGAEYFIAVPIGQSTNAAIIVDCNWPLRFLGTGNAKITMVFDESGNAGDMFTIQNNGQDNSGGMTFEDLTFKYPNPISQTPAPVAIHLLSGGAAQNIRIIRCIFEDCPIGLFAEDGLQISLLECLITYSSNVGTGIWLGNTVSGDAAKEVFITDCLFAAGNAPNGSTALEIQGSDQIFVSDCHIDGFTNGIAIKPGPTGHNAVHLHFTSCTIYTGSDEVGHLGHGCIIQPQPASGGGVGNTQVAQVVFTSCFIELGENATISQTGGGAGILVDATYGAVDTVRFVSCYSTRWPGQGLKITGAASGSHLQPSRIEVLGGMYAGNNFQTGAAPNSYGIWVNVAQSVRISGAACLGSYYYITIGSATSSPTQDVGIYVDANATGVIIVGCDCRNNNQQGIYVNGGASDVVIEACDVRGNGTNGIVVNGTATAVTDVFIRDCNARGTWTYNTAINVTGSAPSTPSIQITNCAGYNDQKATINSNAPPVGTTHQSAALNGYYGPSLVACHVGATGTAPTLTLNGTAFGTPLGSFFSIFLNSAYDTIHFGATVPTGTVFTWTGE
jgi:hypothetical protein